MTFPIGGNQINPDPCTDDEWAEFAQTVSQIVFNITEQIVEGSVDNYTFKETTGGTPGFYDQKVLGEGVYDSEIHQPVGFQKIGGQIFPFTAQVSGGGGGTDEKVKATSTGTAGYLSEVIDGNSWVGTTAYNATTHFSVLASPVSGNTVHFYAPANIIKNSAADGAPGFLAAKHANLTVTAFDSESHVHVYVHDTGSTLDFYTDIADITAIAVAVTNVIINEAIEGEAFDTYKFRADGTDVEGFWDDKVANPATFDSDAHQLVYYQITAGVISLFTNRATEDDEVAISGTALCTAKIPAATFGSSPPYTMTPGTLTAIPYVRQGDNTYDPGTYTDPTVDSFTLENHGPDDIGDTTFPSEKAMVVDWIKQDGIRKALIGSCRYVTYSAPA